MLLKGYRKEIFRPKCNPGFESVHCIAHLDQDIGEALPYLNAELGGFEYFREPPAVTFRVQGKIITVHPRQIAVNALKDDAEADKILQWLQREINDVWERREQVRPSYPGRVKTKGPGDPQAPAENQLQEVRTAHVHGLCLPCGPGGKGARGLP